MPPLLAAVLAWIVGLFVGALAPGEVDGLIARAPLRVIGAAPLRSGLRLVGTSSVAAVTAGLIAAVVVVGQRRRRTPHDARGDSGWRGGRNRFPVPLPVPRHRAPRWLGGDVHRVRSGLALLAIASSGVATAHAARIGRRTCRQAFATRTSFDVALDGRARAGARVGGVARDADETGTCALPITLVVRGGDGAAGDRVLIRVADSRHDIVIGERGLRIEASIVRKTGVDLLRRWRANTGSDIDRLFGRDAPLVRALLIADQQGIAPDLRNRYADAGLVHMLSISGLHVAIIASALLVIASAARIPRRAAHLLALAVVIAYVAALGAPPPAVRSAVMLGVLSASALLQRPVHPWTALALGAALPTVRPEVVLDLGWQLSVAGMASLVAARGYLRSLRTARPAGAGFTRAVQRRVAALHGWRRGIARELYTGVIATAVTAPLIAWTFGRVSIIAPLANIVAGPIVALLQPALFLAMILAKLEPLAQFIADACTPLLRALDIVAARSAAVTFASLHVAPTRTGAVCAGVASLAFIVGSARKTAASSLFVAGAAIVAAIVLPAMSSGPGALEVHMIDVGQGDAIAIRTPRGRWVVIDAGRAWDGGDAGRRAVVPYIQRHGGAVALFILTHAHDDHAGGAASIVSALTPAMWWEPGFVTRSPRYEAALRAVAAAGTRWQRAHPGQRLRLDGVTFDVLAPDSAWTAAQTDANETSVVLRVTYGRRRFLFTGDAERDEEAWIVDRYGREAVAADVLKLGHHGSKTSSSPRFLDAVSPQLGLVSVGTGNVYHHPSMETIGAFTARRIPLLRTDLDGDVIVRTDGNTMRVVTAADSWALLPPSR